jgi:formate hydrogenlyase transcriptional activator
MGKQIECIPDEVMAALQTYPWPGNIREMQNLIERAVILANDGVLPNPLPSSSLARMTGAPAISYTIRRPQPAGRKTLRESELALILQALDATGWVIGGSDGAAAQLGLKRTTLMQRLKKLGIRRPGSCDDLPHCLTVPEPSEALSS